VNQPALRAARDLQTRETTFLPDSFPTAVVNGEQLRDWRRGRFDSSCLHPMKKILLLGLLAGFGVVVGHSADRPKPLKALMVTGGCCHDYENQKLILSEGISARANVEWTIVHEGDDREHKVSIYNNPDWYKGYDVVLHNECFGFVEDPAFIERITAPHKAGLPAVMLHCSTHSYRKTTTDEWRKMIGMSSFSHEKRRDMLVKSNGTSHPVMKGFPSEWANPQDELYKNDHVWPDAVLLARAYGEETKKEHAVIWVNTYGKARTFTTTLGHTNETMSQPVFLDLVTRGLLWSCGRLTDDGKPAKGYGPGGK